MAVLFLLLQLFLRGYNCEENFFVARGRDAKPDEFPMLVPIYGGPENKYRCVGSILTPRLILTAAHCLIDNGQIDDYCNGVRTIPVDLVNNLNIRLVPESTGYTSSLKDRSVTINAGRLFVYGDFNPCAKQYDLGLIELTEPISVKRQRLTNSTTKCPLGINRFFRNFTKPIPRMVLSNVVEPTDVVTSTLSTVVGWGKDEDQSTGDWLQTAEVKDVPLNECQELWKGKHKILIGSICTQSSTGVDTCQGDSGSPLMKRIGDKLVQIGVLSFGHDDRCGTTKDNLEPAVYADLRYPHYRQWLRRIVNLVGDQWEF